MSSPIRTIDGVLVSTSDLEGQRRLFEGVFGLRETARGDLDAATVAALWGVAADGARLLWLETADTGVGVQLVKFEPASEVAIREGADGIDCDALKVIDFLVDDFEAGEVAADGQGFPLRGRAEYSVPADGRFTEGHLEGPDGVLCALLRTHDQPWSRFVRVRDRLFSEILGFSSPVSDLGSVHDFYLTLGLDVVYRYELESESFQHLLGAGRKTRIRGFNYGLSEVEPMIGILHYGLPEGAYRSLRRRAVLPHRGIAAARFSVDSVARVGEICRRGGWEVVAEARGLSLGPYGRVHSLTIRAPHGVLHHFLEAADRP